VGRVSGQKGDRKTAAWKRSNRENAFQRKGRENRRAGKQTSSPAPRRGRFANELKTPETTEEQEKSRRAGDIVFRTSMEEYNARTVRGRGRHDEGGYGGNSMDLPLGEPGADVRKEKNYGGGKVSMRK